MLFFIYFRGKKTTVLFFIYFREKNLLWCLGRHWRENKELCMRHCTGLFSLFTLQYLYESNTQVCWSSVHLWPLGCVNMCSLGHHRVIWGVCTSWQVVQLPLLLFKVSYHQAVLIFSLSWGTSNMLVTPCYMWWHMTQDRQEVRAKGCHRGFLFHFVLFGGVAGGARGGSCVGATTMCHSWISSF